MGIEKILFHSLGISQELLESEAAQNQRNNLFKKANKDIKIVQTEIPPLEILEPGLDESLPIQVIVGPNHPLPDLMKLTSRGIEVFELSEPPERQFDIVDGKHVRYETHDGQSRETQVIIKKYPDPYEWTKKFEDLLATATPRQ